MKKIYCRSSDDGSKVNGTLREKMVFLEKSRIFFHHEETQYRRRSNAETRICIVNDKKRGDFKRKDDEKESRER